MEEVIKSKDEQHDDCKELKVPRKRFIVNARDLGLRPGIDPTSFNKLADELEVEAYLELKRRIESE